MSETEPRSDRGIGLFHQLPEQAGDLVVGRDVAVESFVRALARYDAQHTFRLFCPPLQVPVIRERLQGIVEAGREESRVGVYDRRLLAHRRDDFAFAVWHDAQFDTYRPFALRSRLGDNFPVTLVHHTVSYPELLHDRFLRLLLSEPQPYDSLICTSTAAREAIRHLLDHVASSFNRAYATRLAYRGRLDVIPLAVDTERFRPRPKGTVRARLDLSPDAFVLLWIGRLSAIDKADLMPLLRLFSELVAENPDVPLLLVCAGAEHPAERYGDHLKAYAAELGVGARVRVASVRPEDAHLLHAAADVFVSPVDNVQETFGLTPVEAMACGVPQVVSDWNGYRDTVRHEETGFLVPTLWMPCEGDLNEAAFLGDAPFDHLALAQSVVVDPEGLKQALQTLIVREDLRQEMGTRSRRRAEACFSWQAVLARYEALWQELSEQRHGFPEPAAPTLDYTRPVYARAFGHYASALLADDTVVRFSALGARLVRGEVGIPLIHDEHWGGVQVEMLQRVLRGVEYAREHREDMTLGRLADVLAGKTGDGHARDVVLRHALWLLKYGYLRPDRI